MQAKGADSGKDGQDLSLQKVLQMTGQERGPKQQPASGQPQRVARGGQAAPPTWSQAQASPARPRQGL